MYGAPQAAAAARQQSAPPPVPPLHIFRTGVHIDTAGNRREFTADELAAAAAAYDPQLHEAPIVIGHPTSDGPAFGWVSDLLADDDGLHAVPSQMDPEFVEAVRGGRYRKISAAFYPPDHPANPAPGVFYLRHVGFLGAQPPAVKGLRTPEFADDGTGLLEIQFSEHQSLLARVASGLESLVAAFTERGASHPSASTESTMTDTKNQPGQQGAPADPAASASQLTPEQLAEQQAQFAERETALSEREQRIKDEEARIARAKADEFCEGLVNEGRLLPAQKARAVELLHRLEGDGQPLTFAEGDEQKTAPPAQMLRDLLSATPKEVHFGEHAGADKNTGNPPQGGASVPGGYTVDPRRAELHKSAVAYAEAHNVDYLTAARAVGA